MNIKIVEKVDLERYLGMWYEIARLPFFAEKDLVNITATYSIKKNGKIEVLNQGYKKTPKGELKKATGTAWIPDKNVPGRLKVRFFWPFSADYLIIALDEKNYEYSLVASTSGKYLWILCRKPKMEDELFNRLIDIARKNGIDTDKLIKTTQNWE